MGRGEWEGWHEAIDTFVLSLFSRLVEERRNSSLVSILASRGLLSPPPHHRHGCLDGGLFRFCWRVWHGQRLQWRLRLLDLWQRSDPLLCLTPLLCSAPCTMVCPLELRRQLRCHGRHGRQLRRCWRVSTAPHRPPTRLATALAPPYCCSPPSSSPCYSSTAQQVSLYYGLIELFYYWRIFGRDDITLDFRLFRSF